MYSIQVSNHQKYGTVVEIVRSEDGALATPFVAIQRAFTERRLLMQGVNKKIRFLIDGQILTKSKVESWANEEYKSLPKCFGCAAILNNTVYNHTLSKHLFCSQEHADRDYQELMERYDDEEECDCF
jgi:hypothetical protein